MTDKITMTLLVNTAVFSVMFCVMLLLRKAAGKKISPVLMLVMWAAVLIKLVIPFGFESNLSILPAPASAQKVPYEYTQTSDGIHGAYTETDNASLPVDYNVNAPIQQEQDVNTEEKMPTSTPASAINADWSIIALGIWAAGLIAVGVVLLLSASNLRSRIRHARMETPQYISELTELCKQELGIRRSVSIIVQSALDKPVIMGALRPVLVFPEDAERLRHETLRHVLLHELTHFKGGDLWAIKLMNVLRAVYWFNPLVWICFKLIREDIEIACDQRVIRSLGQKHRLSYIQTVLSFAGRSAPYRFAAAMGLFEGRPAIERRIKSMYGKTRTGIRGRIIAGLAVALIFAVSALTACQPAAAGISMNEKRTLSRWEYSKKYDTGNTLTVDAAVYSMDAETLPTLTVVPKLFESGGEIKAITDLFCPNEKIYDQGNNINLQFPLASGSFKEAKYQLRTVEDGSMQANMVAESNDSISYIDFVNWSNDFEKLDSSKGSCFMYDSGKFNHEISETRDRLVTPESLNGDGDFIKAKEKADECVKGMGIDYMMLNSVSRGEGSYSFYYTRTYNGLPETYVQTHTGTTVTAVDGAPAIFLWDAEYLNIVIQNGNVVAAGWENPSEIKRVDNGKIKILPLEQIKQIFRNAMDDMMTLKPDEKAAGTNAYAPPEVAEVVINRVELGYTKLLTIGTTDDYRLIPTWMFMGYEKYGEHHPKEGVNTGAEMCIVTINAIDGTVIDRGQGL